MLIGHISDLHFTTFFKHNNLSSLKYALDYLISSHVDHIIITGDLTDNADHNDFNVLSTVFKEFGILRSDRLSLVIGNHDIFGGVQTPEDIFNFNTKCKNTNYNTKVNDFYKFYKECFDNCSYLGSEIFPYAKILDDTLLLGMNSIAPFSNFNNPFASNGIVSDKQLNEVKVILSDNKTIKNKIVLIHHHFNKIKINKEKSGVLWQKIEKRTMKLNGKKRLFNLFNEHEIDIVLHGHFHESNEYYRKNIRFINSGGSFKGEYKNEISLYLIDTETKPFKVNPHKLNPTYQIQFIEDNNINKLEEKIFTN